MAGNLPNRKKNGFFTKRKSSKNDERKSGVFIQTEKEEDDPLTWTDGRRIVELGFLSDQLKECTRCKSALHLFHCIKEARYGLGSVLKIKCQSCFFINSVYTGKQHQNKEKQEKGMKIFDINTKCALGRCKI